MSYPHELLDAIPELQDQRQLFEQAVIHESHLSLSHKKLVAWAAALACKDECAVGQVNDTVGNLTRVEQKAVMLASSRMAVTNPYFMGRNVQPLDAGGSLQSLGMRPFPELQVTDETGYHYACVAVSLINQGFACYNSHIASLKAAGESDEAIDQAIRIAVSVSALRQISFNARVARFI
ncbi:carboxymuconolactone decarboxylase family protein [Bacterioplanoides sp.]|uniref:carboxymuconolactone decarboxylase family protein n=1 Tax=Bacterioplanoides sp. TaxID=2066072 RepID=UPI003B594F75